MTGKRRLFREEKRRRLTHVPTDILGKKNRSFFHRHNIFFKLTDAIATPITRVWDKIFGKAFGRGPRERHSD